MEYFWNNRSAIIRVLCKQPVAVRLNSARTATLNSSDILFLTSVLTSLLVMYVAYAVHHSFRGQFSAFNSVKSNQHSPVFETAFLFSKVSRVRLFVLLVRAMEHRANGIDRGKPKYSENDVSQCYFVHHKPHKSHCSRIEPRSQRCVDGD